MRAGAAPVLVYDTRSRARSPEARGRSERAFGTLQGLLPHELSVAVTADYAAVERASMQHDEVSVAEEGR
jgi:hypothetical protein